MRRRRESADARSAALSIAGSVTPIVALVSMVLVVLGIGGAVLGRVVAAKQDAQRAADAAALASADAIREYGLPTDWQRSTEVGQRNNKAALGFNPSMRETTTTAETTVVAAGDVEAPSMIWEDGGIDVQARSSARINQEVFRNSNWSFPRIAIVLDYSGSMSGSPMQSLKRAVERIMDFNLPIDWAGILFSDTVLADLSFAEIGANGNGLRDMVRRHDAGGGTCSSCGLSRAREFLEEVADGRDEYTLFVSDGAPTVSMGGGWGDPEGEARREAGRIWDEADATIYTLHIGGDGGTRNFMEDISGTRDTPANERRERYYHQVMNLQTLDAALADIISQMLCPVGPMNLAALENRQACNDPRNEDCTIRVFMRAPGGRERRIEPTTLSLENLTREGYIFHPTDGTFTLTIPACLAIVDSDNDVVIRYNRAKLIE